MYGRIDKAVNGRGNGTLGEPTYLDRARGNYNKRRFLIVSIFRLTSLPPVANP
jgi:hypothetical protein